MSSTVWKLKKGKETMITEGGKLKKHDNRLDKVNNNMVDR